MFYIYQITNNVNDKCYIGITHNVIERWNNHISNTNVNKIKRPLYQAMKKYGRENFSIKIIEKVLTQEEAKNKEIQYISEFKSLWTQNGYNISPGGSLPTEKQRKDVSVRMKTNNPMKVLKTNKGSFVKGQKPKITAERNEKIKISKLGEKNHNFGNKEASKHLNKTAVCEHCNKTMNIGNYKRWHGIRCNQIK